METLAPAWRAAIQQFAPRVQRAVAVYEQAETNFYVMNKQRVRRGDG
jgi:hypothetical protein